MSRKRTWLGLMAWAVAASLGCDGCQERAREAPASAPAKQEPEMEVLHIPLEPQSLLLEEERLRLAGEFDFSNRYLATVKVTVLSGEDEVMHCGGVAISRHVVLTAGHCVCALRQAELPQGGSRIGMDASACHSSAKVETLFYEPETVKGATLRGSTGTFHQGRVEPHPALNVRLDSHGHVATSRADLALIFLNRPVELAAIPLADKAVRVGDAVTIVGHGYDEVADVFGWERRFSQNRVTRLGTADDERVLVQQPGGHRYRQDSGGPCLRSGAQGAELVGISARWLGEGAACVSIQGYRDWLKDAIKRGESRGSSEGDHSP